MNVKPADTLAELNRGGEIWKDANDHEVDILTRSERGAKNNNGGGSGSSGKKDKKNKKNKNHGTVVETVESSQVTPEKEMKNDKKKANEQIMNENGECKFC